MKKILLFVIIPFFGFSQTQIGVDIDGENSGDASGTSVSVSSNGDIIAIGANQNDGNGTHAGHVRVYENIGGVWTDGANFFLRIE